LGTTHYESGKFAQNGKKRVFDFVSVDLNVTIMSLVELPKGIYSTANAGQS
jgi:hypothetical protein